MIPRSCGLVVTPEMGIAKRVAHRVIFMDQGRIEEDCTKDEFFGGKRGARAQEFLSKILSLKCGLKPELEHHSGPKVVGTD